MEHLQLYVHRLEVMVFSPERSVVDYLLVVDGKVDLAQLYTRLGVELVVVYHRADFL